MYKTEQSSRVLAFERRCSSVRTIGDLRVAVSVVGGSVRGIEIVSVRRGGRGSERESSVAALVQEKL